MLIFFLSQKVTFLVLGFLFDFFFGDHLAFAGLAFWQLRSFRWPTREAARPPGSDRPTSRPPFPQAKP